MELKELLEYFATSETLGENPETIETMRKYSREAQKLTMELNTKFHDQNEINFIVREITGGPGPEGLSG